MKDSIPASPKINRWVWVLIIIGIVFTLLFGFRAVRGFVQMRRNGPPSGTPNVDAIRGWMTIPYIAQIYRIPPDYLYQQLNVPAAGSNEKSLADLNKEYFSGQAGAALLKVKDAIKTYKPIFSPRRTNQ